MYLLIVSLNHGLQNVLIKKSLNKSLPFYPRSVRNMGVLLNGESQSRTWTAEIDPQR